MVCATFWAIFSQTHRVTLPTGLSFHARSRLIILMRTNIEVVAKNLSLLLKNPPILLLSRETTLT
jgi:hypothetical protein